MKKIPEALRNRQQTQREKTLSLINSTVNDLRAEGCLISIKLLCERTGLSRSVFSKPHVKSLLAGLKTTKNAPNEFLDVQVEKLLVQLNKSKQREDALKAANVKLREDVLQLRAECELLRGELHTLMQQHRIWDHMVPDNP